MIAQLLKLDARVLRLGLVAVPVMVALLGWNQVLRPAWQTRQNAAAQLAATRQTIAELPARQAQAAALARETAALDRSLDAPDTTPTHIAGLLDGLARGTGVEMLPIFPGQDTEFEGLRETRYEVEASGGYPQLVAWLAAIETRLANVAIQEASFSRQTARDEVRLRAVLAPKAGGALLLDELTRDAALDFFVMYGSGAGLLGSPGQANYGAANAVLDALAHRRRACGLPGLCVDWGLFADVGLAAGAGRGERLAARGARGLTVEEAHALLPRLLADGAAQVGVVPLDVAAWTSLVPAVRGLMRLAPLVGVAAASGADDDLAAALADATDGRAPRVREALRRRVARVLRLAPDRLVDDVPLTGLGLDSLMGLELKHRLRRDAGVDVPMTELLRDMTVTRLAQIVRERAPGPAVAPTPTADAWTDIEL